MSTEPPRLSGTIEKDARAAAWGRVAPQPEILRQLGKLDEGSSLACENVSTFVRSAGFKLVQAGKEEELLRFPPSAESPYIYRVSAPILSEDGREALVLITSARSGLGGTEQLLLMKREGASWTLAARRVLSIS